MYPFPGKLGLLPPKKEARSRIIFQASGFRGELDVSFWEGILMANKGQKVGIFESKVTITGGVTP